MNETLRELLETGQTGGPLRGTVAAVLAVPHGWPHDARLRACAERAGFAAPRAAAPGETLLVSVEGDRAALWLLEVPDRRARGDAALTGEVRSLLALAAELALSSVPVLEGVRPVPSPWRWTVRRLWKLGSGAMDCLDGASFGLAMVLASASALLGLPLRADTCALAAVDSGGGVDGVGGLDRKLAILSGAALGVRRVLVHPDDVDRARGIIEDQALAIDEVVPVPTLTHAFEQAFDDVAGWFARRWSRPERLAESAESVFRTAIRGENRLLRWGGLATAAAGVAAALENGAGNGDAHWKAVTAELVARRHVGDPDVRIPWPEEGRLERLPRPTRLELVAHAVQSAADGPPGHERAYVTAARPFVASGYEAHAGDVRVMGAIGRALAAVRDYPAAREALGDALDIWALLDDENESARPLCEYLRVAGIQADAEAVDEALDRWLAPFEGHPRTDHTSRAFVRLAAGRALQQTGRPDAAISYLGDAPDIDWRRNPPHVPAARLRWLALAHAATGDLAAATACWRELDPTAGEESPDARRALEDNVLLSRLDRALLAGEDPTPALADLLAHEQVQEVRRTIRGLDDPTKQAERLAREYRY